MHTPRRSILAAVIATAVLAPAAAWALTRPSSPPGPSAAASPSPAASKTPQARPSTATAKPPKTVKVDFNGDFLGWALLDRETGKVTQSSNASGTNSTESMIKVWLVSDYLRRNPDPSIDMQGQAREAIRWSDDNAAQALYEANGGDESILRLIEVCGLEDTKPYEGWWSRTQMSPRDAVKMGHCIANGTAAGPEWTDWVIDEMRQVSGTTAAEDQEATRGGGRWGIIDGVPANVASDLAIKNGWTAIGADNNWHLNCLAISDEWTMSVMMRYPIDQGLDYGANICATVARQLVPSP